MNEDGLGSGVPHGDALIRLVNATIANDEAALIEARRAVTEALGMAGLVDAAAVIGTFTMQNRVADATGLPLDAPIELGTRGLRAELGVERFAAAGQTPRGSWGRALLARIAEPLMPRILKIISRRKQSAANST